MLVNWRSALIFHHSAANLLHIRPFTVCPSFAFPWIQLCGTLFPFLFALAVSAIRCELSFEIFNIGTLYSGEISCYISARRASFLCFCYLLEQNASLYLCFPNKHCNSFFLGALHAQWTLNFWVFFVLLFARPILDWMCIVALNRECALITGRGRDDTGPGSAGGDIQHGANAHSLVAEYGWPWSGGF